MAKCVFRRAEETRQHHNQCEDKYQEALAQMKAVEQRSRSLDETVGQSR